jgi:PAS domain S-box-containing protein
MKDEEKSKDQLIEELVNLRKLVNKKRDDDLLHLTLLDLIEDPVGVVDGEFNYVYANKKAAQLLNIEKEEILSRSVRDLFPENEAEPMVMSLKSVFESGEILRKERQFVFSNQPIWLDSQLIPFKNTSGIVERVLSTSRNITDRKNAEEKFKFLAENMADIVWTLGLDFMTTYVSPSIKKILGFTPEERKLHTLEEVITPESLQKTMVLFQQELQRDAEQETDPDRSINIEVEYYHAKGHTVWMENSMKSIRDEDGAIIGIYGSSRDITERKKIEKTLQDSRERLLGFMDSASESFHLIDENFKIIEINKPALDKLIAMEKTIYCREDVRGKSFLEIYPFFKESHRYTALQDVLKSEQRVFFEDTVVTSLGERICMNCQIFRVNDGLGIIATNITDRKQAEEQIKTSLKEKETLLQEIHHRVKNNMAVVSSLLSLQANSMNDDRLKAALMDSQNRVQSMSAIHEILYQSENLSSIDMDLYLSKLSSSMVQSYTTSSKINLKIEAENILIGVEQASPVGLIVNELITNSNKYAFPDNQEGEIKISLQKKEDQIELDYADNGIGIPQNFDWENAKSMGLNLVKILVENQLDGSIALNRENGTKFTIKFNIEN